MSAWILLFISIAAEVCGTTALKLSDGFTKPLPTLAAAIAFTLAFYLISVVFRTLPVGLVYAVWSGLGIILTSVIAFFAFGQKPDLWGCVGIAMILGGVLVINLLSNSSAH
ncbi:QacE family quaternary ammonium compound efflux SMR transporter [Actinobacillus porcitonsillarum]|uniref:QacE family quaternary ammonium compound efflux SMR transporter n=1 Tax=Actinobacillus porcitonsillarum TaxID=189834 RepID=A0A2U8FHL9_9PAST|nr:multidrug efflux SMR transporter [Actinobacillus porcitonsillarum]AWI50468.1 QacE family quaternary ammonium compound efflux SMR transporter [Actinobacillus porcitonsillarum]